VLLYLLAIILCYRGSPVIPLMLDEAFALDIPKEDILGTFLLTWMRLSLYSFYRSVLSLISDLTITGLFSIMMLGCFTLACYRLG
jgi:hypothetical protein